MQWHRDICSLYGVWLHLTVIYCACVAEQCLSMGPLIDQELEKIDRFSISSACSNYSLQLARGVQWSSYIAFIFCSYDNTQVLNVRIACGNVVICLQYVLLLFSRLLLKSAWVSCEIIWEPLVLNSVLQTSWSTGRGEWKTDWITANVQHFDAGVTAGSWPDWLRGCTTGIKSLYFI